MITYEAFYKTLKQRGISTYKLTKEYNISSNTLNRIKHNKAISTDTINRLCIILDCNVDNIITFKR